MEKNFKTIAKDKKTKEYKVIESTARNKKDFICDLRANGYIVTEYKVKEKEVYDWIIENTNANKWDWERNTLADCTK